MRILNMRPAPDPTGTAHIVARFDCQMTDELRVNNFALVRHREGFRVWPAKSLGVNSAYLHPTLAARVREAATKRFNELTGGLTPHDSIPSVG
jgi:hypothetical protein